MKTATETMKETFNSLYSRWISYCEFVVTNWLIFDLLEDRKDYIDHGLPKMNLTLQL